METGKQLLIFAAAALLIGACSGKDPYTYTGPVHVNPVDKPDTAQAPDTTAPGPVVPPPGPVDVTLMEAFTEDFDAKTSDLFVFQKLSARPDFRYYPGFPSLSESGTKILLLRLDPKDAAGEGSFAGAAGYIESGSLSARMRIPDIASVQSSVGSCASLSLYDPDGAESVALSLRLSEPTKVYVKVGKNESSYVPEISGFKASSKFYIYGFDLAADKISVWIKNGVNADKQILAEFTDNLPSTPLRPALRFYTPSSGKLPLYPYEFEIDWISYTL